MPILDSDYNQYAGRHVHHRPTTPQSGSDDFSHVNPSIHPLPSSVYTTPTKNPSTSVSRSERSTPVPYANGPLSLPGEEDDLDPHDFYRAHQDSFGTGLMAGLGQGEIRVEKRGDGGFNHQEKGHATNSARHNGSKMAPLASRINTSRYATASSGDRSILSTAKSSPALSTTAQKRQTSVRELANKFNETADEVPPVPRKNGSRSPSIGSNAAGQTSRPRPAPRPRKADDSEVPLSRPSKDPRSPKSYQRRGRALDETGVSPTSKAYQRLHQDDFNHAQPLASHAMNDLAPEIDALPRRPLFGEILGAGSLDATAGYGIPPPRRRRGSDGSMHTPNPMFSDPSTIHDHSQSDIPSSTPHALRSTQDREENLSENILAGHLINTRQGVRADQTGFHFQVPHEFPSTDLSGPSSPTSTDTSKRNSQSRIPISTRRLSVVSDSGNSSPSSRNNSALGMPNLQSSSSLSPSRTRAPPPKPLQNPRGPTPHSHLDNSQPPHSWSENRHNNHQSATSPRLNAYISAPMPKKSPPLRSSRPRQPVSSATTSASRARAVDKFGGQDSLQQPAKRDHRPRKPRELENVDIDARKEAIQRSYTKKIGERERRAEEANQRRASLAQQAAKAKQGPTASSQTNSSSQGNFANVDSMQESLTNETSSNGQKETLKADKGRSEKELTIDTAHLSERSVLDLSMEDSPTLGNFSRFPSHDQRTGPNSSQSDVEPSSAITAGTSDSLDTFFDDEPQEDELDHIRGLQHDEAVFGHIVGIGRSRPPSPIVVQTNPSNDASSDKDDERSIQIMLSDTPIFERPSSSNHFVETPTEIPSADDPNSRWSLTSRDSSEPSREDHDERDDSIDVTTLSGPEPSTHSSVSTAASERNHVPWSPKSLASSKTVRTTVDSDTYSTVNRVLDHYHDPSVMSAEMVQDVKRLIQSPNLARQGGWDPKKVTQLYLQQIMVERHAQSNAQIAPNEAFESGSNIPKLQIPAGPSPTPLALLERELRDDSDGKVTRKAGDHARNESVSSTQNLQPDEGDLKPARASLSRPEDWDMSPSLGEYVQQAADSPATDMSSAPLSDWTRKRSINDIVSRRDDPTRPAGPEVQIRLPEIEKHDLDFTVDPESSLPPPLPPKSAQLPPVNGGSSVHASQPLPANPPLSPSEFGRHVSSSIYPSADSNGDSAGHSVSANDTPRPSLAISTPVRESNTSIASQDQSSFDVLSGSTDVASKASSPSPEQKRLTKRGHIIKELVDTEHSFCQDMKVVDDIYKGTSNVIIISPEDVKTLFGNSDQIVAFSTNFLDALKAASKPVYILSKAKRWKSNRISSNTTHSGTTDDQSSINGPELTDDEKDRKTFIGEAFGHHMTAMEKVYAEYLKNHDAANQKLQALQKNPKVQIWLKECRAYATDLTTAWDLDSLLVKPVQRILKYPLLLDQMIEVTPENHPDYTALDIAAREMKGISMRINEMKRRADLLEQVTNTSRKRKESDVRIGFPKAFGRRTEKLRQQVGLSDIVEDKAYTTIREKFGTHFFQIQVVMRDVEMYTNDVQVFVNRFCDFALAMEAHIDVAQTSYPEVESKWRKFRMSTRELATTALTDHIAAVRKYVIEPLVTLWNLHAGPQRFMEKRNKRVMDYARYKAIKERGDRPDKKVTENAELFTAVNDTLKEELPKLFEKTGRLVEACLNNFVQLQVQWHKIWRRTLSKALDDAQIPKNVKEITDAFTEDFAFFETQILSLGMCNGSMINETSNLLSGASTLNGDDASSTRHTTSMDSKRRTMSVSSDRSPQLPQPDFGIRSGGSFLTGGEAAQLAPGLQREPSRRMRASSTMSVHSQRTPEVPGSFRSYSNSTTPVNSTPARPTNTAVRNNTEPFLSMSSNFDTANPSRVSDEPDGTSNRTSGVAVYPTVQARPSSPARPFSGVFSSAMPMSDSPPSQSPAATPGPKPEYNVIFLAASVYEFNIDRARKEAGYPYLTYVAGEIFDVIGEKGELWLAKNQDDATNLVGWIWNKHFVKLAA